MSTMQLRRNEFQTQPTGTVLTAVNSGGRASGVQNDALDQITTTVNGLATFSTVQSMHLGSAVRVTGVGGDALYLRYNGADDTQGRTHCYIRFNALPSVIQDLMQIRNASSAVARWSTTAANKLMVLDSLSGAKWTSTTTLLVNTWYRLELSCVPGATTGTGTITAACYLGDSATAMDTGPYTSSALNCGTAHITEARAGKLISVTATLDAYFDDFVFDPQASTLIGPTSIGAAITPAVVGVVASISKPAFSISVTAPVMLRTNLFVNPSLEYDPGSGIPYGITAAGSVAHTVTKDATQHDGGSNSVRLNWHGETFLPGVTLGNLPMVIGRTYVIRYREMAPAVPANGTTLYGFISGAAGFPTALPGVSNSFITDGTWRTWGGLIVATATAHTPALLGTKPIGAHAPEGDSTYVDSITVEDYETFRREPATPFFDGDNGGAWSGTPGNSTSTRAVSAPMAIAIIPTPTINVGVTVQPLRVIGVAAFLRPIGDVSSTMFPDRVAVVATAPKPTESTAVNISKLTQVRVVIPVVTGVVTTTVTPAMVAGRMVTTTPVLSISVSAFPPSVQGAMRTPVNTVTAVKAVALTPTRVQARALPITPFVAIGSRITLVKVAGVLTVPKPTTTSSVNITPTRVVCGMVPQTPGTPGITAGGSVTITQALTRLTTAVPKPVISISIQITRTVILCTGTVPMPGLPSVVFVGVVQVATHIGATVLDDAHIAPAMVSGRASLTKPTFSMGSSPHPAVTAGTTYLPKPDTYTVIAPARVQGTTTMPITLSRVVTPVAVVGRMTTHPAVSSGQVVNPAAVAGVARIIPPPVLSTLKPVKVTTTAQITTPTLTTGSTETPAVLACASTVPQPVVQSRSGVVVRPMVVAVHVEIDQAFIYYEQWASLTATMVAGFGVVPGSGVNDYLQLIARNPGAYGREPATLSSGERDGEH